MFTETTAACRHAALLGHVILMPSQPFFALTPSWCVVSGEATNTNFIVFSLTWPGRKPTIYHGCVLNTIDIHTQILILGPVAAHSQYLFGLKVNALITSPPSNVYKCFPSFKSHNMACPSWKLYNLYKSKYDFNYLWSRGQMAKATLKYCLFGIADPHYQPVGR